MCKQAITVTVTNAKIEAGTLGTQRKYLFAYPVIGAPILFQKWFEKASRAQSENDVDKDREMMEEEQRWECAEVSTQSICQEFWGFC